MADDLASLPDRHNSLIGVEERNDMMQTMLGDRRASKDNTSTLLTFDGALGRTNTSRKQGKTVKLMSSNDDTSF